MQKQAPSKARIATAVGFALSCFALLLYLWVAFGGPVPFKAKGYRFTAQFPEAVTLSIESDVRIGGVSVGKVKELSLPRQGNATQATIEIDPEFAPIPSDTRAILRQKTLLGETYIGLTRGTSEAPPLEDGGALPPGQTEDSTQIDEIFDALDPRTRSAFRVWMRSSARSVSGRGADLSFALGNLGPFARDATEMLRVLDADRGSLRSIVRDSGEVFRALTARDQTLARLIASSRTTFGALASRERDLSEAIRILPTFEDEALLTLNRLDAFAGDTEPLVRELRPVATDLSPTLHSLRRLSPPLKRLLTDLDPLIDTSTTGLPALQRTLEQARPLLVALDPFLANLNPVVRYLDYYKRTAGDFLGAPASVFQGALADFPGQPALRHALRVVLVINAETLGIYQSRPPTNRGNAYLQPDAIGSPEAISRLAVEPSFDCDNAGGEQEPVIGRYLLPLLAPAGVPACVLPPDYPTEFGGGRAPTVSADP